jgi:DNA-directed RNA polymerase subunit M/transcription elongation factor TFIIS
MSVYSVDIRNYMGPLLPAEAYDRGCVRMLRLMLAMMVCSQYQQFLSLSEKQKWRIIMHIEEGVHCMSETVMRYQTKFTFILHNLQSSKHFIDLIIAMGDDALKRVCFMSEYEMNPAKTQPVRDKIQIQLEKKIETKSIQTMPCPSCKNRDATIIMSAQIRASDEGRTIKLKCNILDCGREWTLAS